MDQEIKKEFENLAVMVKEGFDAVDGQIIKEIGKAKFEILDAMDDKIVNLKGDLILLMRGEDKKLLHLIDILKNKNVLTQGEREEILKMQPFPQLV